MIKRLVIICIILVSSVMAQEADSTKKEKKSFMNILIKEEYGKNIIKYNVMQTAIFVQPKNMAFSYERVTFKGQSVSIGAGYLSLPNLTGGSVWNFDVHVNKNAGFTGFIDYRFYLKKHNKRPAPNGVYIGPFYSTYQYTGNVDMVYVDQNNNVSVNHQVNINTHFSFQNIGFQLGYQFIFFKRLTLDMILFGPAYSVYELDVDVTSNMTADEKGRLYDRYKDNVLGNATLFKKFVDNGNFHRNGRNSGYSPNFRYTFQFGWHF